MLAHTDLMRLSLSAPVATAVLLVGSIYIVIFSFVVVSNRPFKQEVPSANTIALSVPSSKAMTGYAVRAPLEPFLTTRDLIRLRVIAPTDPVHPTLFELRDDQLGIQGSIRGEVSVFLASLFRNCFFPKTLANDGRIRYHEAFGFFVYWVFVYATMSSVGLANEFMIQILTPKFMTYFLLVRSFT